MNQKKGLTHEKKKASHSLTSPQNPHEYAYLKI